MGVAAVILKYFMKNVILSRRIWIFGILFGLFLLYAGYSQPLGNLHFTRIDAISYSGQWMAIIILFMFGTVSTTVAQTGIYSSSALPYLFKFSRYSRKSYLYNISFSSLLVSLGLSTVLAVAAVAMFSAKFGFLVQASNPGGTYVVIALGACFMNFLAIFLVLMSINYMGTKSINYIHFVPLMMTYGFGIMSLTTHIPNSYFFYFVPFSAFLGIFASYFSGTEISLYGSSPPLSDPFMLACLVAWTVALTVLDLVLLKKLKVSSLEEAVQV